MKTEVKTSNKKPCPYEICLYVRKYGGSAIVIAQQGKRGGMTYCLLDDERFDLAEMDLESFHKNFDLLPSGSTVTLTQP